MSRGIAARTNGDKFIRNDKEFLVKESFVIPLEELEQKQEELSVNHVTMFFPKKGEPKFCIGILLSDGENKLLFIKHIKDVGDGTGFGKWQTKEFAAETGFIYDSVASKKEALPYKPSNLIGNQIISIYDVKDVVCQNVQTLEEQNQIKPGFQQKISQAFQSLENNELPIFKNSILEHTAIRDYIGEILAPVAFANNVGIEGITINDIRALVNKDLNALPMVEYQTSNNANLIDSSLLWSSSFELGLSSKGSEGASASIFSLFSRFKHLETEDKVKFKLLSEQYSKEISFLELIFSCGIKAGPLVAAYILDVIEYNDLLVLLETFGQSHLLDRISELEKKDMEQVDPLIHNHSVFGNTVIADEYIRNMDIMSGRLYSVMYKKKVRDPEKAKFEYYALACIAKEVARILNLDEKYKVNEFLVAVLRSIHFIQIHAKTKAVGNDVHFTAFETIYSPHYEGRIEIEADKSFYATKQPQGGFGFKFLS